MSLSISFKHYSNWNAKLKDKPLIIAGPCSAESEEQVLKTAKEIDKIELVKIYRAGIWKPRTRPGSFDGAGTIALKWLQKVKEQTSLLTTVEVATPQHIEDCLKHNVDILWIGARTTSNPFSVQELANALKGVNIPVMIKNPINPDLQLWSGAIERIANTGIKTIAAIHRGFYPFEKTNFRNIPKWEVPIELKTRFPDIPIICDPSHISGKTKYVAEISQKAMDMNMDGLMIETHCCPEQAKSDIQQQLTPEQLKHLIENLSIRNSSSNNIGFINILEQYRNQIDSLDMQMLELLSQRMDIVEEIGEYKKENNVTILQLRRWENILRTRIEHGNNLNLPQEFIKKLLQLVHKASIQKQTEVMYKDREK